MTAALPEPHCGIFGGTFNPIHMGHLRAAEEAAECLGLDEIRLLPSGEPPHKTTVSGDPVAPAALRLAWVERAVADNPRLRVDPREVHRSGPSYTVETLRSLAEELAPARPVLVIGQDAFALLHTWREPKALLTLAHFAVMTRPQPIPGEIASLREALPPELGAEIELTNDGLSGRHRSAGTWLRWLPITALDVSASDVRRRLRAGRSVRYLVPESVRADVVQSRIYGDAKAEQHS